MICCVIYCIQNIHYWIQHAQANTSAIVQWSPQYHNNPNCSHPVSHDLPVLHNVFVGREEDIREIVSKTMKANILNINGAPAFGKSTVAIHAGYRLLQNVHPLGI